MTSRRAYLKAYWAERYHLSGDWVLVFDEQYVGVSRYSHDRIDGNPPWVTEKTAVNVNRETLHLVADYRDRWRAREYQN